MSDDDRRPPPLGWHGTVYRRQSRRRRDRVAVWTAVALIGVGLVIVSFVVGLGLYAASTAAHHPCG